MPFFCDLFDYSENAMNNQTAELPPELIPYTQTLYYDDTSTGDKKDYKILFHSPWDGNMEPRSVIIGMDWEGGVPGLGDNPQSSQDAEGAVDINNRRLREINRLIADLSKGTQSNNKAEYVPKGKVWEAYEFLFGTEAKDKAARALSATRGQIDAIKDIVLERLGVEKQKEEQEERESWRSNGMRVQKAEADDIQHTKLLKVSASALKTTLNGINVTYGKEYHDSLVISKTIVCKSSESSNAASSCLNWLANIVSKTSPEFSYFGNKADNQKTYSTTNIAYTAPNNFKVTMRSSNTAYFGGASEKDTKENDIINYDLFDYRGEFQLRQGYNIYRNLVPKSVRIVASPDYVFLKDSPFENENSKSNLKSSNLLYAPSTKQEPAKKLMYVWRTSNFLREITLYNGTTGYLFPQWFNIIIELSPVEPYDSVRGTQQLFCISDNFIEAGTSASKTKASV